MKRLILLSIVAMLAACASTKPSSAERLAMYRASAGAPVKDFSYFGGLNGWQPLGDSALAVWTRPNQAYLLDLTGRCPDLEHAPSIMITNFGNRVSALDRVRPIGGASMPISCRIKTISPLDLKSLKAAEEMRKAEVEDRKDDAGN